jgi:hypothetical protein
MSKKCYTCEYKGRCYREPSIYGQDYCDKYIKKNNNTEDGGFLPILIYFLAIIILFGIIIITYNR